MCEVDKMSENMKNNTHSASLEMEFANRAKQVLSTEPILSARDVEVEFTLRGQRLNAIRRCSLDLYDGETLAIVGEFFGFLRCCDMDIV